MILLKKHIRNYLLRPLSPLLFPRALPPLPQIQLSHLQAQYLAAAKHWHSHSLKIQSATLPRRNASKHQQVQRIHGQQFIYETRFKGTTAYKVMIRRRDGKEVLDPSKVRALRPFMETMVFQKINVSHDLRFISFGVDLNNDQNITFFVKETQSQKVLYRINNCKNALVLPGEHRALCLLTEGRRPMRISVARLNHLQHQFQQVMVQNDKAFVLDLEQAKDISKFIVRASSFSSSKIYCFDQKQNKISLLHSSKDPKVMMNIIESRVLIIQGQRGVILQRGPEGEMREVAVCEQQAEITNADFFLDKIVLYLNKVNSPLIQIISLADFSRKTISLDKVAILSPALNAELAPQKIEFFLSTPFRFDQPHQLDLKTFQIKRISESKLAGQRFKEQLYQAITQYAPSQDGNLIPLTILKNKQAKLHLKNKLIIEVYGAYGTSLLPDFNVAHLAALQQQFIIVFAHVRGGSQKGTHWHLQAKNNRTLSSSDLLDCIAYLTSRGYSCSKLMGISTSSAGAIAVFGLLKRLPWAVKAVYLKVPFLLVLRSLLNQNQQLSASDWEQFGNPRQSESMFQKIQAICPQQNLFNTEYPPVFIRAADKDYRCPLPHTVQFVRRLKQVSRAPKLVQSFSQKNVVLKIIEGSHQGSSQAQYQIKEQCQKVGFMEWCLTSGNKQIRRVGKIDNQ